MHQFYQVAAEGRNSFLRFVSTILLTIAIVMGLGFLLGIYFTSADFNPLEPAYGSEHPTLFLFFNCMVFLFFLAGLIFSIYLIHERKWISVLTPNNKLNLNKILFSFSIWFGLSIGYDLVYFLIDPANYQINPAFTISQFLPLFLVCLVMVPIQTSFEELFFRGYLNQQFGLAFKRGWISIILTSVIFGSGHLMNPEVEAYGEGIMLANYIGMGLFLAIITLLDDSLELALGVHAANNIYAFSFVTMPDSVMPTPAVFTVLKPDQYIGFVMLFPMGFLFLWLIGKKYPVKWNLKVFGKIDVVVNKYLPGDLSEKLFFKKADSAEFIGLSKIGKGSYFAQGSVIRSGFGNVEIGNQSFVLENSVIIGSKDMPVKIGSKTVFGHRSLVIGAEVGDLCEIGNASIIMPEAKIGNWCLLGEGTLISEGMIVPDYSVVVGKPGRIIRKLTDGDIAMITRMRNGNTELEPKNQITQTHYILKGISMGKLYEFNSISPQVHFSTFLFDSAEITGDVIIGENCIIGSGVKIVGDSHGPVRIGNNVQILENTVLHLLPDNILQIDDNVVIGPGCMIHGCHIGENSIIEPGVIVCDNSVLGKNIVVKAGSVVKQRSEFPEFSLLEGFPAKEVGHSTAFEFPKWALNVSELGKLVRVR